MYLQAPDRLTNLQLTFASHRPKCWPNKRLLFRDLETTNRRRELIPRVSDVLTLIFAIYLSQNLEAQLPCRLLGYFHFHNLVKLWKGITTRCTTCHTIFNHVCHNLSHSQATHGNVSTRPVKYFNHLTSCPNRNALDPCLNYPISILPNLT